MLRPKDRILVKVYRKSQTQKSIQCVCLRSNETKVGPRWELGELGRQ